VGVVVQPEREKEVREVVVVEAVGEDVRDSGEGEEEADMEADWDCRGVEVELAVWLPGPTANPAAELTVGVLEEEIVGEAVVEREAEWVGVEVGVGLAVPSKKFAETVAFVEIVSVPVGLLVLELEGVELA